MTGISESRGEVENAGEEEGEAGRGDREGDQAEEEEDVARQVTVAASAAPR
jgi:hypothetical protein